MFKNLLNDLHIAYDEMQNNNDTISPYDAPATPTSFCTFTNKRMVTPQLGQQFNTEWPCQPRWEQILSKGRKVWIPIFERKSTYTK